MSAPRAELLLLYCFTTALLIWNNIVESKAVGEAYKNSGLEYLKEFGYISESQNGKAQAAQDITHSLKAFQRFAGLNVTGKFDEETVKKMKAPRCGDKDPILEKRRRRYELEGSKWKKKDLTYRIENDPYRGPTNRHIMTPELISKTIKAALQKWSFAADLTFTELKEGEADIMIVFTAGKHGDRYDFDGRGKALAHAFYPGSQNTGYAGDAHFDLDEKFSLTEEESTNFIWVTTHEFGHSLGLKHTPDVHAIMYPWYTTGKMGNVKLGKDDKRGIRQLYGKSKGRNEEAPIILPVPPRKECKYSFNAMIPDKHHNKIIAIRGHDFYLLNQNGEESKGPRHVEKRWEGLKMQVGAAYFRKDGSTIFFTRHRYYKYHSTDYVEGPKFIEEYGLTADLRDMDAAISFPGNGETYFFKGDKYWKYDEQTKALAPGYPKLIRLFWRGLPDNIDAALQTVEGETFFFKGQNYYKFNHYTFSVFPGYPKPIGPYWLGCKDKESGLEETLPGGGNNVALGLRPSNIAIFVAVISWFLNLLSVLYY